MNLQNTLNKLEATKQRRDYEKRVNGKTDKYKTLHREYLALLARAGKETES